jgi:hypothetical protein
LISIILAFALLLAPLHDRAELELFATTLAAEVESQGPLEGRTQLFSARLATAIAFRESSFQLGAVGDNGRSKCWFQVLGGSRALLTDARACVRAGYTLLKASAKACPEHPVAVFARGTCGVHGKRISADRVWLATKELK